ncbi:MAG: MBOAT family protein [Clostridia bacterium]|nr:MBOAT family protein [Clostridia bacterium]
MLFSSVTFLYCFLPVVLIMYYIAPGIMKNAVLLISSLFFYAWGEPLYVILMVASILIGYVSGILIEKTRGTKAAKPVLAVSLAINIGLLGYFKYSDFFIENFNAATGLSVPLLNIALPIGISFYTFQLISYLIDVYRGDVPSQKNPVSLGAYISMFPQLIAGPIVRYSHINDQLSNRKISFEGIADGVTRFAIGLGKKILLANQLGELCDIFRQSSDKAVLFYWMYGVAYALHVYFDFSGYSDMAIGLGKMLGFDLCENFNYPFISKSVAEFWRRWHISLGSWFRDYVYIPLGGNRVSKPRWIFNILVVWMLTGLWHGAAWTFVVWGLLFAALLVAEKIAAPLLKKMKILNHVYVIFVILISFIIFNASDLSQAASDIAGLFGAGGIPAVSPESLYYLRSYAVLFVLGIIGSTPAVKSLVLKVKETKVGEKIVYAARPFAVIALLLLVTAYLADGSFNPFLYFRF